ncbi:MAG: sulfite exporter TauE/SafE family protein [Bdellovibrionota bacterium]|nr:MAG: sulfite exporter TauE/SafE family protein [Bdellovibrionota bacterium]
MAWQLPLIGLVAGVTSGLFGVGGGVIIVPGLMLLLGLSVHMAIGISLAVIIPTAMIGTLRHWQAGNVDLSIAFFLALGAIVGGYLGASLAVALPAVTLKKIFGAFLIVLGLHFILGWPGK